MCASEGCGSSYEAQQSTYEYVMSALFPCQSKIDSSFRNPGLFENVVTQFVVLPLCIALPLSLRGVEIPRFTRNRLRNPGGESMKLPDESGNYYKDLEGKLNWCKGGEV